MSKLENQVFVMYQDGDRVEQISAKLGISEAIVRAIILRKFKSN